MLMKQARITRNILTAAFFCVTLVCYPLTHASGDSERDISDLISCSGAALDQRTCKLFDLTPHNNGPINSIGCGPVAATTVNHRGLTLLSLLERTDNLPLDTTHGGILDTYMRCASSCHTDTVRHTVDTRSNIGDAINVLETFQELQDKFAIDTELRLNPHSNVTCTSLLLIHGAGANQVMKDKTDKTFVGILPYQSSRRLHQPVITTPTALFHFTAKTHQFVHHPTNPQCLCSHIGNGSYRIITILAPDTLVIIGNTPFWQELKEATNYIEMPAPTNELALCRALSQHCTHVRTRQTDQNIATRLAWALQRHARKLPYRRTKPVCFFVMQRHCPDKPRISWFHTIKQPQPATPLTTRASSAVSTQSATTYTSPTPPKRRKRARTNNNIDTSTDTATINIQQQIPAITAKLLGLHSFDSSPIMEEQRVPELKLPAMVPLLTLPAKRQKASNNPKRRKKEKLVKPVYEETMPWQHKITVWGPIPSFTIVCWLPGNGCALEFDFVANTPPDQTAHPEES